MFEELPTYHGVGFFGENIFYLGDTDIDESELQELYPEIVERLEES